MIVSFNIVSTCLHYWLLSNNTLEFISEVARMGHVIFNWFFRNVFARNRHEILLILKNLFDVVANVTLATCLIGLKILAFRQKARNSGVVC